MCLSPFDLLICLIGIGLEVHEDPYLRGGSEDVIDVGHTFSDEPGVYIEGKVRYQPSLHILDLWLSSSVYVGWGALGRLLLHLGGWKCHIPDCSCWRSSLLALVSLIGRNLEDVTYALTMYFERKKCKNTKISLPYVNAIHCIRRPL